jgi:hypothetical protein
MSSLMRVAPASCPPSGFNEILLPNTLIDGGNPSTFKHATLKVFVCATATMGSRAHTNINNLRNINGI